MDHLSSGIYQMYSHHESVRCSALDNFLDKTFGDNYIAE